VTDVVLLLLPPLLLWHCPLPTACMVTQINLLHPQLLLPLTQHEPHVACSMRTATAAAHADVD
jgi:hypothetical protein